MKLNIRYNTLDHKGNQIIKKSAILECKEIGRDITR